MKTFGPPAAFSLVEVVLALAVISFTLLTLLALLPIGLQSNHITAEETHATGILTALEADLRNTSPGAYNGQSQFFGATIPLPYMSNAVSGTRLNTAIATNQIYSTGLSEDEVLEGHSPVFLASVIYTQLPTKNQAGLDNPQPIEARLIISWPYPHNLSQLQVSDLTSSAKFSGYVESYVSFPSP